MTKKKPFTVEESWPQMKREVRLLTDIHEYPKNPRTHPPAQVAMLADLLKRFGPDQDIVIDGDENMILKGHGRRRAAIIAGLKEFPVTVRYGLSDAEKIEMRISDNSVSILSGWDPEIVRGEIATFKSLGGDVALLGFGNAQLVQFTTTPGPPAQFPPVGDDIPTDFCCPRCSYKWSGDPMAGETKDEPKGNGKGAKAAKTAKAKKAAG